MRLTVELCIYEHIKNYVFATFPKIYFVGNDADATPVFYFKLLLRPWYLSHGVERQKLMVNSRRSCLCVSEKVVLWLTYFYVRICSPNVLFETL